MPQTPSGNSDRFAPSFVPISMQISADPFIAGATTIGLTIIPEDASESMSFVLGFYTLGDPVAQESTPGITVELVPLPEPASHYFANPPTSIPMYGDTAVYNLQTLASIMELSGKTLVITATSDSTTMLSSTASVTVPIATAA